VRFNGTTATPTSWSATSIVVPVPAGATTGNVVVTVGGLASNGVAFTINRPPTLAVVANQTNAEGNVVSLQLVGSDPDGNPITYSATNLPGGLSLNASTGLISGTLSTTSAGNYSVTATVADATLSASRSFSWTVTNVNHAPTLAAVPNQTSAENSVISLQLVGTDADADTLSYGATNLPGGLSINAATGRISGTLTFTSAGSYIVTATVSDGSLLTASQTFTWTVTNVNRPPTLTQPTNQTSAENATISLQLAGSDPDGNALSYSATGLPPGLALNPSTGLISGKLTLSSAGTYTVSATVSDASLTNSKTFTWTVTNTNQPPVLVQPANQTNARNVAVSVQLVATDPDGNALTYSASGLPPTVSVNSSTGLISGTLSNTSTGSYTVTATASDGSLTNSKTFTWTVTATAGAPIVNQPATKITVRNLAASLQIVASDPGNKTLTYSAAGLPAPMAIDSASGLVSGTPTSAGTYSATVTASNGTLSTSKTFTWIVNYGVNQADFDGDLHADATVYRPANGTWYTLRSADSYAVSTFMQTAWGTSTDIPVAGDYDGDGKADPAFYRPSDGSWHILYSSTNYATNAVVNLGVSGDVPVPGDYDGDGRSDVAVFHPATGTWQIINSSSGATTSFVWGGSTDIPVPGDYDGDGKTDLAVFRPSNNTWYVLESHANFTTQSSVVNGVSGDFLVPGDYDGDGKTDTAVFHPATAQWKVVLSSTGATQTTTWGTSTDRPVPLDFDGDGKVDFTVFRPATGEWLVKPSTGAGATLPPAWGSSIDVTIPDVTTAPTIIAADAAAVVPPPPIPSDALRAGDTDGDHRTDITVFRPSDGTWYTRPSSTGFVSQTSHTWGTSTDIPVPGDYDGDGITDPAFFRPSTGQWQILLSSTNFVSSRVVTLGTSTDLPVPADYDGDGKTDIAVYHPATGTWQVLQSSTNTTVTTAWGLRSDIPVPGDYDGDGKTDLAVYRPALGQWRIMNSATSTQTIMSWGTSTDMPVPADYDGDGRVDVAVYRPSTGQWLIVQSSTSTTLTATWGGGGTDLPMPADYDGDGKADLAVYRDGTWWILESHSNYTTQWSLSWGAPTDRPGPNVEVANTLAVWSRPRATDVTRASDFDGDGIADVTVYQPATGTWASKTSSSNFTTQTTRVWGTSTDLPVPGDYDGDGKADPTYYRPSTGQWRILFSSTNYTTNGTVTWGASTDIPVPGDYDGDGLTDVAVFRPSTGEWRILTSSSGFTASMIGVWGVSTDQPVPGDYDGDGRTDLAVFRPSTGQWIVLLSSSGFTTSMTQAWGGTGDIPTAGDFDGDGKVDFAVYRPSVGTWHVLSSLSGYSTQSAIPWGTASSVPVVADYDGDGLADYAVFQSGVWKILLSSTNFSTSITVSDGTASDVPLP
jgi:hypothetical protein